MADGRWQAACCMRWQLAIVDLARMWANWLHLVGTYAVLDGAMDTFYLNAANA